MRDMVPYMASSVAIGVAAYMLSFTGMGDFLLLVCQGVGALGLYIGANVLFPSRIQRDVWGYITGKNREL